MQKSLLPLLTVATLVLSIEAHAQDVTAPPAKTVLPLANGAAFEVGTNVLNVGIGFGASGYEGSSSASPAFSVAYEKGILDLGPVVLGIGGHLGFQRASEDLGRIATIKRDDILVSVRAALHYSAVANLDLYGSLGLGLRYTRFSVDGSGGGYVSQLIPEPNTTLVGSVLLGGRYYFTEKIGAFAELGYDQTYFKAGAAIKF